MHDSGVVLLGCAPTNFSIAEVSLAEQRPAVVLAGEDVTIAGSGFFAYLAEQAAEELRKQNVSAEVIDVRVLKPFCPEKIVSSVQKTGRLIVLDGGWKTAGFAAWCCG